MRLILRDFFSMSLKQQNRDTQKVSRFVLTRVRKYYKLGAEYRNLEEDELDENMQDSNDVTGE